MTASANGRSGGVPEKFVACQAGLGHDAAPHQMPYREIVMSADQANARVQKHRKAMRLAGLRPVRIWVPDTRRPGFDLECQRQSLLVAQADAADVDLQRFMDEALDDLPG